MCPVMTRSGPQLHNDVSVDSADTFRTHGGGFVRREAYAMSSKSAVPFILFGLFLLVVYAVVLVTGYAPLRYGNGISLSEQPVMFWLASSIYLVGGLILIAIGAWRLARR
jgi:hypothetical protein